MCDKDSVRVAADALSLVPLYLDQAEVAEVVGTACAAVVPLLIDAVRRRNARINALETSLRHADKEAL
jgi:hypothetical protein